jgi:hypothetical protein
MRKLVLGLLALAFMGFVTLPVALADSTSLQGSLFVLDGTQYLNNYTVPGINAAGFNQSTGLGTLTFVVSGPGAHSFDALFDSSLNLPFFNEFGATNGSPAVGQSWQIDDPAFGTIIGNTQGNSLDSTNHIPGTTDNYGGACNSVYDPGCAGSNDDVSMAMGFNFILASGQQELITLILSHTAPGAGFYLSQTHPPDGNNPNGAGSIFFSGSAVIRGGPPPVPEPSSLILLLGSVLFALVFRALRHKLSRAF